MIKGEFLTIEPSMSEGSYVIKDEKKIKIGKIQIMEYSEGNRNCTAKLYFDENKEEYLADSIKSFMDWLFSNSNTYKINIIIREDIELKPFLNLNFHIEGVITNNSIYESKFYNEIMMCIDGDAYNKLKTVNLVRIDGDKLYLRILTSEDAEELLSYYERNKEYLS